MYTHLKILCLFSVEFLLGRVIKMKGKARNSNIELLRFISLIWIMLSHCVSYGIFSDDITISTSIPISNRIFCAICSGGGDIGVGVFFIITGYFLAESKTIRNIIPYVKQVYFYGALCTLIALIAKSTGIIEVEIYVILSQLIIPLFGTWWFVAVYFILIFLSPSINVMMDRIEKKTLFVMVAVALWYSVGLVVHSAYYPLLRGVFYYMIGVMIKRVHPEWVFKKQKTLCGILLLSIIMYTAFSLYSYNHTQLVGQGIRFIQFCIISPISALFLFLYFVKMEIRTSKVINVLGAASFGVYLFHEAPYNRTLLWSEIVAPWRVIGNWWMPLYCVIAVAVVYGVVVVVGKGRIKFFERDTRKYVG